MENYRFAIGSYNDVLNHILTLELEKEPKSPYISPLNLLYNTAKDFYNAIYPIFIEEIKANLYSIYHSEEYYCSESIDILLDPKTEKNSDGIVMIKQAEKSAFISAHYQILYSKIRMDDVLIVVYLPKYDKNKNEYVKIPYIGLKAGKDEKNKGVKYLFDSTLKKALNNNKVIVESKFLVQFTSFKRQLLALINIAKRPNTIVQELISHQPATICEYKEVNSIVTEESNLNVGQLQAIDEVLNSKENINLIQGPPGTGKSHTLVALLKILLKEQKSDDNTKILICTPSNKVLDDIIRKVAKEIPMYNYFDYNENFKIIESGQEPIKMLRLGSLKDSEDSTALNINIERLVNVYGKISNASGGSSKITSKMETMKSQMDFIYRELARIDRNNVDNFNERTYINRLKAIKFKLEKLSKEKVELENAIFSHQSELNKLKNIKTDLKIEEKKLKANEEVYEYDEEIIELLRGTRFDLVKDTITLESIAKMKYNLIEKHIHMLERTKNMNVFSSRVDFIKDARVIFSTLNSTGSPEFYNPPLEVSHCIVDEATQSTMPELLVALKHLEGKLVLIGDHKQLPATTFHKKSREWNYNRSFFELLVKRQYHINVLNQQFRMKPSLAKFSSLKFYNKKLTHADSVKCDTYIPNECKTFLSSFMNQKPLSFLDVIGKSVFLNKSYYNIQEVRVVMYLLRQIPKRLNVGVIAPYSQQVNKINERLMGKFRDRNIEVNSIDGFQGKEKDIIIISCVKSSNNDKIIGLGFLEDERRLNVAITRAKYAVIVVGNSQTLCTNDTWSEFIDFVKWMGNYMFLDLTPNSLSTYENIDAIIKTKLETDLAEEEEQRLDEQPDQMLIKLLRKKPKKPMQWDNTKMLDFIWYTKYSYHKYFNKPDTPKSE